MSYLKGYVVDSIQFIRTERIFVVGGFDGSHSINTGEYYNPNLLQWTMIKQLTVPRSGLGLITYHEVIYAIGGSHDTMRHKSGMEQYDQHIEANHTRI